MTFFINTTQRVNKMEIMDDFSIDSPVLHDTLNKLSLINRWLGGDAVTIDGLKKLLINHPKSKKITILDLGCGSGETLRDVARFGKNSGYSFDLVGIDANKNVVEYAQNLAGKNENIKFLKCNIFSEEFKHLEYDLVICSLFLHHFEEVQLTDILSAILAKTSIGILVNDLHRNSIAYFLFKSLSLFISNEMVVEDGLTSIRRGFKYDELKQLSEKINSIYHLSWKWAFRYQWLIQKK
jgi:2-polyprenyl-3-methyl-5-hydroxy-6-metoxy-1,4-benzoquinol methylase